ncbi:50S ribosomal protein L25/general stress protein Ctc [Lysinibacillus pakistanensis]|uniref:Large ribosomal subunit protein bL25 n=1 Tax=Lysinibacillus pakistanensis TaxID=759811 RepID=A0ABX6DAZ1_9BACI|nr:50S ribosomal protein L25/general stress protein Ctc [Lysinibacillus pakistanensis]
MTTVLTANKREKGSRSSLTQIRQNGAIPGVVYGYQMEPTAITVDARAFAKILATFGNKSVFQLDMDGRQINAVLTEVQRCALKGNVKHVDFKSINMSEELEVDIPVTVVGHAAGVADGGFLLQPNREVRIKVKPTEIPESIEVDVTNLAIGTSLYVGDIRQQFSFDILQEDDYTLVTITPPAAENEQEDDTVDDTPEVIEATGQNTAEPRE